MKFAGGMVLGAVLTAGSVALYAQGLHPRLHDAIEHLRDARVYIVETRHDFGGHKAAAIRATDAAIRELEACYRYR